MPLKPAGQTDYLTQAQPGDPLSLSLALLDSRRAELGLSQQDLAERSVSDQFVSRHNGVTHIYLQQRFAGLDVNGASISINVSAEGRIINLKSSFVPELAASAPTVIESGASLATTSCRMRAGNDDSVTLIGVNVGDLHSDDFLL